MGSTSSAAAAAVLASSTSAREGMIDCTAGGAGSRTKSDHYNRDMGKTVAVIGASSDRRKFGNKALRSFQAQGFTVVPINPNEREVEGHPTYPSVLDYPGTFDMATVYVPAEAGVRVMEDLAKKGVPEIWLNPGADEPAVVARARDLGLKVVQACSIIGIGDTPWRY
jgi:predicted CoA-binding protein